MGEPALSPVPEPAPDNSLLAKLRAEREAMRETQHLDLPIPGFARLVARFEAVNQDVIMELDDRRRRDAPIVGEYQAAMNLSADVLIQTCVGVFERPDKGELIPLNTLVEHWGDRPVVFDERLVEAVGATLPDEPEQRTARAAVFAVFGVFDAKGNDKRMSKLSREVSRWLNAEESSTDEDF